MPTQSPKISPRTTARAAGILYVLLIPLGVLGIMYIPEVLIVAGDIDATIANILANEMTYRLSIVSALATQLVNFALVLFLYKLLAPAGKNIARIMVLLIVMAVPMAMLNELNHFAILLILDSADPSSSTVAMLLDLHNTGINIVQIFWGLWLFPMGYLVFKSTFIPRIIGILLMIGCFGYLVDSFISFLDPEFAIHFSEFLFFGEIAIAFWLLIKGINVDNWHKVARTANTQNA